MRLYIYLNIISFNCARQLHLRYIEETDRSNYFFYSSTEYAIYRVLQEWHSPVASTYIGEIGSSNTIEIDCIRFHTSPSMIKLQK